MADSEYEKKYWWNGNEFVAGIDEAGRGPIAGPLVIGICIFPAFYENESINDSKQLTDRQRRKLLEIIKKDALYYSYEVITVEEVDRYNIYAATQLGMERAIKRAKEFFKLEAVLTDAMPLPHVKDIPVEPIIHGDALSVSIAAASIVAKVTRDDMMIELDSKYPGYNLKQNKGYCTPEHVQLLNENGITEIHRKTYEPIVGMLKHDEQLTMEEYFDLDELYK